MIRLRTPCRSTAYGVLALALFLVAVAATPGRSASAVGLRSSVWGSSKSSHVLMHRWSSGVYPGRGIDRAAAERFAKYVGRPLDNVHVFLESRTWRTIGYEQWEARQYVGFRGQLIIDFPLLPSSQKGSLANVAAGKDDRYFAAMAHSLVRLGRGHAVLVLASEFNGNWQTYSAFRPRIFIAAFRHVAKLLKSISPHFVIDWTGNAIDNQSGHNPFRADYPGNDVVDLVGVDAYADADSRITNARSFDRWAALPFGIDAWARFAKDHGKRFSLPEWGLSAGVSRHGSGDVPAYITGMHRLMTRLGHELAFEDYFNEPASTIRNSLHAPDQMPKSSARYRVLWSQMPAGAACITPRTSKTG